MRRSYNLADLFEIVAAAAPDRLALVAGPARLSYADLDRRSNQAARALAARGIGPGDWVGIYGGNRSEWVETMIACHKLRAVPVNVNYRYTVAELRHVLGDAGVAGLVYEQRFSANVAEVRQELGLRCELDFEAGYVEALAGQDGAPLAMERSSDDLYVLYTGGTTGLPKGVLWRCEDIFFGALRGGNTFGPPVMAPEQLAAHGDRPGAVTMSMAPLMHGGAQWAAWITFTNGGTFVLSTDTHFDPEQVWQAVAAERVMSVQVVGDGMARPLVDAYDPARHDASSLFAVANGGAALSEPVRQALVARLPQVRIIDGYGTSEAGADGTGADATDGARGLRLGPASDVLDDDLEPVGIGEVGRLARSGHVPLGYHRDPEKSAATFRTDPRGVRWVLPGDFARREADGTVTLLGRGSTVINSGGEKVFPDEVEDALKAHPGVYDAIVVGLADDRYGQAVTALVVARPGVVLAESELRDGARQRIAGYKVPRRIFFVDEIARTPAAKPDHRWAQQRAEELRRA